MTFTYQKKGSSTWESAAPKDVGIYTVRAAAAPNGRYRKTICEKKVSITGKTDSTVSAAPGEVTDTGSTDKNAAAINIPSLIRTENGEVYNVTAIGDNAFKGNAKLKKITFKGSNVKKIGSAAFKGVPKSASAKVPKKKYKAYNKVYPLSRTFFKPVQ